MEKIIQYKKISSLFAHEKSRVLIEAFPRSGSTVILSNLALANLGIHTEYGKNNVNHMRGQLQPLHEINHYVDSALLVRSPFSRLESFYLTKLVAGEPKSVIAIGEMKFTSLKSLSIHARKQLKGYFGSSSGPKLNPYISTSNLSTQVIKDLIETKSFIAGMTFADMIKLFSNVGFPNDSHIFPQSEMKTFRLAKYKNIFNLSKFNSFKNWYEHVTLESFDLKFNKTQPNNRLGLKKFHASPVMTVSDLQNYLLKGLSPIEGTLLDKSTKQAILKLYPFDYDLHLLSLSNEKFDHMS